MNIEDEKERIESLAKNLIPCRAQAYIFGSQLKIVFNSNRYWDLFSFYQNNWHYITTLKYEKNKTI
jgi:hypothetical protein